MLPTPSSLLSRPLCGTLRRAQFAPSAGVTKTYFTPNSLGIGKTRTHRPLVNFAHAYIPTPLPCPAPTAACNCTPQPILSRAMRPRRWMVGSLTYWLKVSAAGFGLALTFLAAPVIYCDYVPTKSAAASTKYPAQPDNQTAPSPALPPPPLSSVNFYELTFGTVCGVCAGVFVKKGSRVVAFALGGVFVLLQYLGSLSLVRVDWNRAASRFENLFYTKDAKGVSRPPNVGSLFRWIIDFLTADFQPRATFVAGFVLGLRIG